MQASAPRPPGPTLSPAVRLAGYSFVILLLELALIRYIPGSVRVFGFYLNFVLIAAFLGMGAGLLRAQDADRVRWLAVPALVLLFGAVGYFGNVVVQAPLDPDEFLWGVFFDIPPTVRRMGFLPVVTFLFLFCTLLFVPLGAALGREFARFPPLLAYSINIGGSLLGVLGFAAASALRTPPLVWFAAGLGLWLFLAFERNRFGAALAGAAAVSLAIVAATAGPYPEYWSPYYRINVFRPTADMYSLSVNGSFHQYMLKLDTGAVRTNPFAAAVRQDYLQPFVHVARVDTALVLGAGTGNDVSLLLELGADYVDAVEIDPVILDVGKATNLQDPYGDPRVHAHVDDARAFVRKTPRRYDVIVLGTLDSQTLLSAMSSLRLDNYVYTLEAMRAARARLKPGGRLVTYHMSPAPYVAAKIHHVLVAAFGSEPLVFFEPHHRLFNYTFVAGGPASPEAADAGAPPLAQMDVTVPRDDWPYLYLTRRTMPMHYVKALAAVLGIALGLLAWAAGRQLRSGLDAPMFCTGLGFLLLETKSVSEMSLLFGSTWAVNVLVFASILAVILLANLLVLRRPPRHARAPLLGFLAAVTLAFAVPIRTLLPFGGVGQGVVGGLVVALPVFFGAIVFATLFRSRTAITAALAYNLLGAVVGGILEYSAMVVGIKALYLGAALAYGAAVLLERRRALAGAIPA